MMKWCLIGTGAVALTSGIAYYVYNRLQPHIFREVFDSDEEDSHSEESQRPDVVNILTWALINSMRDILNIYGIARESKGSMRGSIAKELETRMETAENEMCKQHGWDLEEYYAEIAHRRAQGDPELDNVLAMVYNVTKKVIAGEKPVVNFEIAPELTKEVTLTLYRWIALANAYARYTRLFTDHSEENLKRKEDIVRRLSITMKPLENYAITLQRAYFTYRTNDEEFDKQANELISLNKVLNILVSNGAAIPEFAKDPFDMGKDEIDAFYTLMFNAYARIDDKVSEKDDENEHNANDNSEDEEGEEFEENSQRGLPWQDIKCTLVNGT